MSRVCRRQAKVPFADYDGVLHRDTVCRVRGELLVWAPLLEEIETSWHRRRATSGCRNPWLWLGW